MKNELEVVNIRHGSVDSDIDYKCARIYTKTTN